MYAAAQASRLTASWQTPTSSSDSELRTSLSNLRARGRALTRDSAYAKRAGVVVVNNVIGTGMGLQAQVKSTRKRLVPRVNESIEQAWKQWNRPEFCHVGGSLHFSDLERMLMAQVFETGEVFIRQHYSSFGGSKIPYALEVIESERVPHDEFGAVTTTGNELRMGVEVDRYYRPVAYWVRDRHPSDFQFPSSRGSEEIRRIPAAEIIHLRVIDRWPQTRGVPWLHAVARKLNDMDGYSEAEIIAARASAQPVGSEQEPDPLDPTAERQEDGSYQTEWQPGMIFRGKKIDWYSPNRPNSALDPFMRYMLREVAAGIGVSYESISRDYSQSNYSSSRLSLLEDRDLWRVLQAWFIRGFRDTVHRAWLQQAVFAKAVAISVEEYALNREKFEAVKYKPRGWSWVDPTKEVQAYKEAERAGYITKTQIISNTAEGKDIEDVFAERVEETEAAAALGLQFDTDPGAEKKTAPETVPPKDPEDDKDEDTDVTEEGRQMRLVK
jgi:lambda family phage portal protein